MNAPCPFCGCDEPPRTTWQERTYRHEAVRMECPECGARGPAVEIERRADDATARGAAESAMALWEKRA